MSLEALWEPSADQQARLTAAGPDAMPRLRRGVGFLKYGTGCWREQAFPQRPKTYNPTPYFAAARSVLVFLANLLAATRAPLVDQTGHSRRLGRPTGDDVAHSILETSGVTTTPLRTASGET